MILFFITIVLTLICALWSVVLMLDIYAHGNRGSHRNLLTWSLAATLLYVGHTFYFLGYRSWIPVFDSLYVACNLAVYPLYLRYLLYLTEGKVSLRCNLAILLPPLLLGLTVAVLYALMSGSEQTQFINTYLYGNTTSGLSGLQLIQAYVHIFCRILFMVWVVITLVVGIKKVRKYNNLVDTIFSDIEDKRLHNISSILLFMAITCFISMFVNIIGRQFFIDSVALLFLPFLLFSILLFAICYTGYCQVFGYVDMLPYIHDDKADDSNEELKYKGLIELTESISIMMQTKQCFLIPNLRVGDLANMLGTNSRYIQRALNENLGMSFAEYVNRQRVDYARHIMKTYPDLNMTEVSSRSGFSSMSAFYRNMKMYG